MKFAQNDTTILEISNLTRAEMAKGRDGETPVLSLTFYDGPNGTKELQYTGEAAVQLFGSIRAVCFSPGCS